MPQVAFTCGPEVRDVITVPDGTTAAKIMRDCNPETGNWPAPVVCLYRGEAVLREQWEGTVLAGDDLLVFHELPLGGGGDSNPLQAVFTVALIAAAVVAQQYWTTPIIAGGTFTWGSAAAAGIMLAGGIISSQIFSVSTASLGSGQADAASPTYSVSDSGNRARLYEPMGVCFGRMRVVPDKAATTWTQYLDNDMYLYAVYGLGLTPCERHRMGFGEVTVWEQGEIIESAYSSESGEEYVNSPNQALTDQINGGAWTGPWRASPPGGTAKTFNITLNFPNGLCVYEFDHIAYDPETGDPSPVWNRLEATAVIGLRTRELDASGNPVGDWREPFYHAVTANTEQAFTSLRFVQEHGFSHWELQAVNVSGIPASVSHLTWSINNRRAVRMDTITSQSPSLEIQVVEPGHTVTLFPDNVETSASVSGQELLAPDEDGAGWIGPFPVNSAGTTTEEVLYGLIFPSGCGQYDSKGNLKNFAVGVEIQHRVIDDYGAPLTDWYQVLAKTYSYGTLTPQRLTERVRQDPAARYEARVRRTTAKGDSSRTVDTLQWASLTAMIPGSLTYPQTVVAVKIKASNTLSQNAASNFFVVQTAMLPEYDRASGLWGAPAPTRSWGAAVSHVLRASYGGDLPDRRIDLDALWSISERLTARGWHFDAWLDSYYTVWPLLVEMCKGYRVVPRLVRDTISFVLDEPGRPVRHTFTPYDIVRGSLTRTRESWRENSPDYVDVQYADAEANWLARSVPARLPEMESLRPATRSYLGVTGREHAFRVGIFDAAVNRWRRLGLELEVESMGRLLGLGDVVTVSHPRLSGTASGAVCEWDAGALLLVLEGRIPEEVPGEARYLSLTRQDGSPWGPCKLLWVDGQTARLDPADYAALLAQGQESPFAWLTDGVDRLPSTWTLQQGRDYRDRYLIRRISPIDMYRYRLELVSDSDLVDQYDDLPVPPWEYRSSLPDGSDLPAPPGLRVALTELEAGVQVSASWDPVTSADGYEVQYGASGSSWLRAGRVTVNAVSFFATADTTWLRVAAVRGWEQSGWSTWHQGEDL